MTRLRRTFGGSVLALMLGAGCSSGVEPSDEAPVFEAADPAAEAAVGDELLLGRFDVSVRIRDGVPDIDIRPAVVDVGTRTQAEISVLGSVTVVNDSANPPAWNAGTETLEGYVRVRNNTGSGIDEPSVKIKTLTNTGAGDAQFLNTDYSSGSRVNARYGYADLGPSSSSPASRRQPKRRWVVSVPGGTDFNFAIDVLGKDISTLIDTDGDDDSYNSEPATQPQGGDCDDTNASVFPGSGGGGSSSTCSSGTCSETCAAGCPCDYQATTGARLDALCLPGSDCSTTCTDAFRCNVLSCGKNATCDQSCNGTSNSCLQSGCGAGSTCTNTCTNTPTCWTKACAGGNCDVDCTNGVNCRLDNCTSGATCKETCTNSSNCRLGCAASAASCALTCDGTTPCVLTCSGGFGPNCTMDCNGGPPTDCPDGVTRVCNRACP